MLKNLVPTNVTDCLLEARGGSGLLQPNMLEACCLQECLPNRILEDYCPVSDALPSAEPSDEDRCTCQKHLTNDIENDNCKHRSPLDREIV